MRATIDLAPGDLIDDRYRIAHALGAGGSGAVYAAYDESAGDRAVAIKVLSSGEGFDADQRSGLELEFSLLTRLSHPNVVNALAIGVDESDGTSYLVEELVVGPTLEEARHSLAPADYYWIAHGILEGLAHVHRRGWVHHDIKPANILLSNTEEEITEWVPKLADLGVASLRGSDPHGRVSGTIPFLSPERLVGRLADPRSDVWALGMSLLFCISGTLPVDVDSVREAAKILGGERLPALRDLKPTAPQGLEVVIGRMLARDRRARYRDATDALGALRREMSKAGLLPPGLPAETLVQSPELVGRERILSEVLHRLSSGRSPVVTVRGEGGSGRSRLLREVALEAQLRGARAVFVDPGVGLSPWRRALERLGRESDTSRVEEVVADLIDTIERRRVVLLIDDIDARDGVAGRVLERLRGLLIAPGRIAGVVACGDLGAIDVEDELILERLKEADVTRLIHTALGTEIAPQAVARFVQSGHGNPARLVAAMTRAVRTGALERVAGVWEFSADADVFEADSHVHAEAVAELGDNTKPLLFALAVLGPSGAPVELDLVREVVNYDRERFGPAISALCHLRLANRVPGGVALAGRVDQIALSVCDAEKVRALHGRAWQVHVARRSDDTAILARHAWGAELDPEAAQLTDAAATAALAVGDHAAVLALTDHLEPERLAVLDRAVVRRIRTARAHSLVELSRPLDGARVAGQVLADHPGDLRAAQVVVRAAVAAGDAVRAQRALDVVGQIHARSGTGELDEIEFAVLTVEVARVNRRPDNVESAANDALDKIRAATQSNTDATKLASIERARGRVHTALGASLALGGNVAAGKPTLLEALRIFTDLGDNARIAEVSAFLAAAADLSGEDDERVLHLARGLESAERAGADSSIARLLNIRGLSNLWRGRTEEAIEAFEEAERRGRLPGLYRVVAAVSGNLVVVFRRAGAYSRALEAARRSVRVKKPLGDQRGITATTLNLADVYFDLGAYNLSAAAGRRVVRDSIAAGNRRVEVNGRVTLATALVAEGKVSEAREALGWVTDDGELEHQAALEVKLAIADVLAGERDLSGAADRFLEIEELASERDEPFIIAAAAYRRGVLLGELGVEDLRRAIESASRCQARHIMWRARAQLGLVLSATGEDAAAGAEFARASEALGEVLEQVPSRHVQTYVSVGDRVALIAAIRAGARFTERASEGVEPSARGTSAPTALEIPSERGQQAADERTTPGHAHHATQRDQRTRPDFDLDTIEAPALEPDLDTTIEPIGDASTLPATDTPDRE